MFERWFGQRKNESGSVEERREQERRRFFEKQKREQDIRDHISAELGRPELEEVALKMYKLRGQLSIADPVDLQYVKPNLEKATTVKKAIDDVIEAHGQALAEYMKLKRKKYTESGVLNPSYVDAEAAAVLFQKGLMEKWEWESDPSDRFWEEKRKGD